MPLTKPFETYEKPALVVSYRLADALMYKGALAGIDANGYLVPMDHATAGLRFAGVAGETVNNSSGSPGDKSLNVTKSGSFVFKAAGGFTPAQADVGKEVYANSDWEVQVAAGDLGNTYKVGRIVGIESASSGVAGVRVRIDGYVA